MEDPAVAKVGYLDGFDEYNLFVTSSKTISTYHRSTHYTRKGTSLPDEITFPEHSLSIENPSIGNFSFIYSSTYTYRSHYWREDAADYTIHWRVYTDKPTTPPITELPEAFTARYPSLSVTNLTYSQSEFFRHQDGYTYAQLLLDIFAGIIPERREFFQETFQQR